MLIRNLILKVLDLTGQLFSYLYPPFIPHAIGSIRNYLYTGYLRHRFAQLGQSTFIWKVYTLMGAQYIKIGDHTVFETGLQLTARKTGQTVPEIVIGDHCLIRKDAHITAINSIVIGNDLLTGTNVLITDNTHGLTDNPSLSLSPGDRPLISKGKVKIGNRVWLGNNVCILPGVTLGDGVVVGANSVVTHDIPANSVAVGSPAKVIQQASEGCVQSNCKSILQNHFQKQD